MAWIKQKLVFLQVYKGNQKFSLENNHLVFQKPGEEKQDRRQAMEEMQKFMLFSDSLFTLRQSKCCEKSRIVIVIS